MIEPREFYEALLEHGISFFTGVPDSLLKSFGAYLSERASLKQHIVAANEGGAIALATGHYLSTGRPALVYMQNSGLGNAINPLLSLADVEVYSIPVLLMIGWRGEPGRPDEPQHIKQGRVTPALLDGVEIPHEIIGPEGGWENQLSRLVKRMNQERRPVALVVRNNTLGSYDAAIATDASLELSREDAINLVVEHLQQGDIVVATTGMASRELFEIRQMRGNGHDHDFLTVGSMGHASQIALGIALTQPQRRVVCLDGDGSVIMHSGNLATVGHADPANFVHMLLNNGSHDSVGGQPTAAETVDFPALARAFGYRWTVTAQTEEEVTTALKNIARTRGPIFIEIKVRKGARRNLGRPTTTPVENRDALMRTLLG